MSAARPPRRAPASLALLAAAACTTVHPPPRATLREPCRVFVLRSACHLALALPDEHGAYARFGFGDRYYMSHWDWTQYPWAALLGLAGLFGEPTSGTLERIGLRGADADAIAAESGMELLAFDVERARAVALRASIESQLRAPLEATPWLHECDDGYSLWWDNCQSVVADWCRELDCSIDRFRLAPRWAGWSVEREEAR